MMSIGPEAGERVNPKTQMTNTEMKKFVRDHFEEFINRKNIDIADINFAPNLSNTALIYLRVVLPGWLALSNMWLAHTRNFPTSMSRFSI